MSNKEKTTQCPICNTEGPEYYISRSFEGFESTWVKCMGCGTYFMSPFPTEQESYNYYRQNYKIKKSPGAVSHSLRYSEENKNIIFNEYRLSLSDIGISVNMLCNKKVLDYGCANGFFLDFCFENGCFKNDLFGYDIAEDLLNEVREKDYNILNDEKNFFDYMFLWDVLEHVPNPKVLLRSAKSYLIGGGKDYSTNTESRYFIRCT